MPFYHAIVRPGLLSEPARQAFAGDVVDIHCRVTGAPRSFVHVLVSEDDRGKLTDGRSANHSGDVCRPRSRLRPGLLGWQA